MTGFSIWIGGAVVLAAKLGLVMGLYALTGSADPEVARGLVAAPATAYG